MNRTCQDNEHEFIGSSLVEGAEVCIYCGILRVPSEINPNYYNDDDYEEDDFDEIDE